MQCYAKKHGLCRHAVSIRLSVCLSVTFVNSVKTSKGKKVKEVDLYSAFIVVPHTQGAQVRITQCYLQITPYVRTCLYLVSIHQMVHPQTEVADI